MNPPTLRPLSHDDPPILANIYRNAVTTLGPAAYTPEQIDAWAAYADNPAFANHLHNGHTLVANVNNHPAAFGQLHPNNTIALLYCLPHFTRHGLASLIHQQLESIARNSGQTELITTASHLSKPFFTKLGYLSLNSEVSIHNNVSFIRHLMRKPLCPSTQ